MNTVIETERLILRAFTPDDLQAFIRMNSDPDMIRYAQPRAITAEDEAREAMAKGPFHDYEHVGYGRFACVWKATGEVIGFSGLKFLAELNETELGYRFWPVHWGKGLATEAGQASLDFARQTLGLKRLIGLVHPDNGASAQVLRKLGFEVEKQLGFSHFPGVQFNCFARGL